MYCGIFYVYRIRDHITLSWIMKNNFNYFKLIQWCRVCGVNTKKKLVYTLYTQKYPQTFIELTSYAEYNLNN